MNPNMNVGSNQEHIKDPAHLLMSSSFLPGYEGTTPLSQSLERELKELGATYSYNDEIPPYSIIFLISDADTYKMSGAMYYVSPNNFNLTDIRSTLQELTEVITNKLPILLSLDSIREKVGVIQQGLQDRRTLHITELEYESLLNDCLGKYKIDYMELSGHWEVVNYIKDVTLALSNKRIKKGEMKKSKNLKFKVGGVNVLQETFVHQLTSIPGISENKARAIVKEYPTMDGLMKAFRLTGLFALQDISVVAKTGNSTKLGKKLAEKVFCYYTTENPADDIKEFGK